MVPVRGKLFLFVLIGCLISCAESLLFDVKRSFEGELFPADRDVCTTQSVTFTSVLNQEPETSYSIGFTVKTRETHGKFVTADRNKITYINDTMAKYVYDVPPLKDVETPTYFYVKSYYWQKLGDDNKKLQIGKTTAARVYPYPEKVVDFDCIVNNYATMICSWKYGRDYGIHMPEVIFKWKIPSYTSSWTDCWYVNEEKGLCTWNETQTGFFYNSNITISLTLNQKCDINVTSQFHVDTSKIVKPNPVSSMKLSVINSTCITLLWNTTESGQYHPKEHLIIVSSRGVYIMNTTLITTIVSEQLEHKEMFCSLRPYTEYSFNVSIKPTGTYSGFFSDPVQKTAKTYSDIPSGSPGVTEGGYSIHHRDCEDGRERRRVCLFWKPIETEHENGPMKGLLGIFLTIPPTLRSIKEDWAEDVTYGCSDILCDTKYLFTIKARNINGTSTQESTVTIPAFSRGTVRPDFIVESTNSSDVHISWTYTGSDRASSFLVAWCRNENGDCKMRQPGHEVGWKHVNVTEIILQIDTPQDYLYGVSVLIGEYDSTGVEWQDCIYLKDSKPERKPQNVVVSNGAADNSLVVTWDKLACTSNEPYIDMYNIEYYKEEDKQRRSINVSQSGKARLELKNLDEGQIYVLTVRGVTKNGIYGPESLPQTGVPVNKSLNPSEIVGITLTVLVCFIFAGIGVVCAVWRCKKKAQEAIKQAGNITIPEAPEPENSTSLLRRTSEDIGCDQTSPSDKINSDYKLRNLLSNLPYVNRCVVAGQSDIIEDTGSSTLPVTHTPDNTLSRKLDLFTVVSKPDICTGKQRSKLSLNIPEPIAFTSESELYLYKQDDGNVTNDSSREKRIDCERISKSLGSSLDPNHNSFQYLHVLSSDGIPDRSRENDTASNLNLETRESSSYILSNDQYVTNISCMNGQFRNENNLVMDIDEPVPIFTIENGQEIVDDRPCIDTHTLCYQCQVCVTNGLTNNPSNKHYNTHTTELQTCAMQTYPVFESVNLELTDSIAPQPQDTGKMSLTNEIVQASEKVKEPSATTPSQAL